MNCSQVLHKRSMEKKTKKINFSRNRIAELVDKYSATGKYLLALRLAYSDAKRYGFDEEVYLRLSDIYENMGLHGSAINILYRFLDIAKVDEDICDAYEGLAVNYMNMGKEAQAAYYYNNLIALDENLPQETKFEIANAFAKDKRDNFRFVWPPEAADCSRELDAASRALKSGDCEMTLRFLSAIEKGNKDYAAAQEMKAVAYLLSEKKDKAEEICLQRLQDDPDDIRVLATLAAVYLEQGKTEESRALAMRLYEMQQENTEDLYKVATVCCENGLHQQAYDKFCQFEEKLSYDGRVLYFKAVAAYHSGKYREAERAFDTLCTVYPDAEVAAYYLKKLRLNADENGNIQPLDEAFAPNYFYHLPQEERETRAKTLLYISKSEREEAALLGLIAERDGLFRWCFDELDGTDLDLQYLALVAAAHAHMDGFVREMMLDSEVAEVLKVETLRLLYERNEHTYIGIVLYHIYHKLEILPIKIGRKRHRKFIQAYAKVSSKFSFIGPKYGKRLQKAAQDLYEKFTEYQALDRIDSADDLACAIFLRSGIKEAKDKLETTALLFDAKPDKVRALLAIVNGEFFQKQKENKDEKEI